MLKITEHRDLEPYRSTLLESSELQFWSFGSVAKYFEIVCKILPALNSERGFAGCKTTSLLLESSLELKSQLRDCREGFKVSKDLISILERILPRLIAH